MMRARALTMSLALAAAPAASAQTSLNSSPVVVSPAAAVTLTVTGPPRHHYAIAGSTVNAGLFYGGAALALGLDARVIVASTLDAAGHGQIQFVPPFAGTTLDRFYLQAVTSPSPGFVPFELSGSVIIRNADTVGPAAGGDLTGVYPNPTIALHAGPNIVAAINASGSTIDTARVAGLSASAGGDLTGTFPSPTIAPTAGNNVLAALNNASGTIVDARISSSFATKAQIDTCLAQSSCESTFDALLEPLISPVELGAALATTVRKDSAAGGDLAGTYPGPTIKPTAGNNVLAALNGATGTIADARISPDIATTAFVNTNFLRHSVENTFTGVGLQLTSTQPDRFLRFRKVGDVTGCVVDRDVFQIDHGGGLLAEGEVGCGTIPASAAATRLLWYPAKAAFRAGTAVSDQWDDSNIGLHSLAAGLNTVASGVAAVALGSANVSAGAESFTAGGDNHAAAPGAIALGGENRALGPQSVALGFAGIAGAQSAVAIGDRSAACGAYSLALGSRAVTADADPDELQKVCAGTGHTGAFVWADHSTDLAFRSTADNQFSVRAAGGVRLVTSAAGDAGVTLDPGGSAWNTLSDANAKIDFEDLDGEEVLARLRRVPIREWSYKTAPDVRHVGPTAQDFHAAFGLGSDALRINTIDPAGIALRAIQALESRTREIGRLREDIDAIRAEIAALRATMHGR